MLKIKKLIIIEMILSILLILAQIFSNTSFKDYYFLIILMFSALNTVISFKHNMGEKERGQVSRYSLVFLLLAIVSKVFS